MTVEIDREKRATSVASDVAHPALLKKNRRNCTTTKIRGFLHLYIGEEAAAVVMENLDPDDNVSPPIANMVRRWRVASSMGAVMHEMYGNRRLRPRSRRINAPFDKETRLFRAMPSSAVICRWQSVWHWPTKCAATPRHLHLFRRRRCG